MGDATRPPCPLVAQRGETAVSPLWKPLLGMGSGSGKRSRGCPICTLRFDATISTAYKAGQALHPARDLVRNSSPAQQFSQNPFPPNLHLCASLEQTLFLFHRARRIFFLVFQKENGGCILHGKAVLPCAEPGQSFQKRISPWLPVPKRHNSTSLGKGRFLRQSRT